MFVVNQKISLKIDRLDGCLYYDINGIYRYKLFFWKVNSILIIFIRNRIICYRMFLLEIVQFSVNILFFRVGKWGFDNENFVFLIKILNYIYCLVYFFY